TRTLHCPLYARVRRWRFFFSSRRRHTRLVSDWSSDVCSSDLLDAQRAVPAAQPGIALAAAFEPEEVRQHLPEAPPGVAELGPQEIGRASCRERGWSSVGAG